MVKTLKKIVSKIFNKLDEKKNYELEGDVFQSFFIHHPNAVLMIDVQGNIKQANLATTNLFGYPNKELVGSYTNFLVKNTDEVTKRFQDTMDGTPQKFNSQVRHKGGSIVEVNIVTIPLTTEGQTVGVCSIVRNITEEKKLQNKFETIKYSLKQTQTAAKVGSWEYDLQTKESYWSQVVYEIFGIEIPSGNKPQISIMKIIHPDDREVYEKQLLETKATGQSYSIEYRIMKPNGQVAIVNEQADVLFNEAGNKSRLIGTIYDVTEQRNAEQELAQKEKDTKLVYESLDLGIWSYDVATNAIVYCSTGVETILDIPIEEFLSGNIRWRDLVHESDLPSFDATQERIHFGKSVEHEYRVVLPNGETKWLLDQTTPALDDVGEVLRINGVITDITALKELLHKVEMIAKEDFLTGLPNRRALEEELETLIIDARSTSEKFAVVFLDMDRFKYINDTLGHTIGDKVVQEIADRLNEYKEAGHFVSRVGGDEFIIIFRHIQERDELHDIAQHLLEKVRHQFVVDEFELVLSCCIGVTVFPVDGEDKATLMKNADVAMYRAKELGKNDYQIFTQNMNVKVYQQYTLERDMRKALTNGELTVFYQAKVKPRNNLLVGAEALIRWEHPTWGMVSPGEFIPIAEETGLIHEMGDFVIEMVCKQIREWLDDDVPVVPVSVNISPFRFLRKGLVSTVKKLLKTYDIPGDLLEFEITESSLFHNEELVLRSIKELRELGIKIALDDFGTGYSSMTRLKGLDLDVLKIDRSFIKDVEECKKSAIILDSLLLIGKGLNIDVVVEGVETQQQLQLLKQKGCEIIQGYIFSKPIPASDFTPILVKKKITPNDDRKEVVNSERRKFLRIDLDPHLESDMTVVEINGKRVDLGKMLVAMENIGLGGSCFLSHIQLPVRPDLILRIGTEINGEKIEYPGKIVWKQEAADNYYYYGVEFLIDENEREKLSKLLNRVMLQLKQTLVIPNSRTIDESVWTFLKKVKES